MGTDNSCHYEWWCCYGNSDSTHSSSLVYQSVQPATQSGRVLSSMCGARGGGEGEGEGHDVVRYKLCS